MKKIVISVLTIFVALQLSACFKESTGTITSDSQTSTFPVIKAISHTTLSIGNVLRITGKGFGNPRDTNIVFFNDVPATVYNYWTDTEIHVVIPQGAVSGKINIKVKSIKSNELSYIIVQFQYGSMQDIDGNTYKTIIIGQQEWMAENLRVSRFRNGESIPMLADYKEWQWLTTPEMCFYLLDSANYSAYGRLYNWYAVNDSILKLAPQGWHIPSKAEWMTLVTYLGGDSLAGKKLKESGILHWWSPNTGATNETGFSALPGGQQGISKFEGYSEFGRWWSSTEAFDEGYNDYRVASTMLLNYNDTTAHIINQYKTLCLSVRCVKD